MRVFVLCTGRCGSTTFIKACEHITNFTAKHESLAARFGEARFAYPDNHIEADNRLSWQLGIVNQKFGDDAYYVHLKRNRDAVAQSYLKRYEGNVSIVKAFAETIRIRIKGLKNPQKRLIACYDYIDVVNYNIEMFLTDKTKTMTFEIERANEQFLEFWKWIGAEGSLDQALEEFTIRHNKS